MVQARLMEVPVARTPVTVEGQWAARLCPYGSEPRYAAWVAGFLAGWAGATADGNWLRSERLAEAWECGRVMGKAQGGSGTEDGADSPCGAFDDQGLTPLATHVPPPAGADG